MRLGNTCLKSALPGLVLVCLLLPLQAGAQTAAQAETPGTEIYRRLLEEVQQLRVAIERSNLNTYRALIAVERLRLQQEQVTRMTRELEGVRNSRAERAEYAKMMTDRQKELESSILLEVDHNRRLQLEQEQKQLRAELSRFTQWEQQQISREAELRARLELEQARLADLNERLDGLERELEKQASPEQSRQK